MRKNVSADCRGRGRLAGRRAGGESGSIPAAGSASGPRRTAESSDTPAPFSQSHRVKGAKTDGLAAGCIVAGGSVISPDFSLELTGFFPGKHLIHFLVLKMKDFRNFVLDFDAEQVYLKLQVTNLKNKEVTVNPKPQTLRKNWFFENPIP